MARQVGGNGAIGLKATEINASRELAPANASDNTKYRGGQIGAEIAPNLGWVRAPSTKYLAGRPPIESERVGKC